MEEDMEEGRKQSGQVNSPWGSGGKVGGDTRDSKVTIQVWRGQGGTDSSWYSGSGGDPEDRDGAGGPRTKA